MDTKITIPQNKNKNILNDLKANALSRAEKNTSQITKRGRKIKYANDDERKQARRMQQKAYRERIKKELNELRQLKNKSTEL